MLRLILLVLACLCFGFDQFNVPLGSIKMISLGLLFFAASFLV